MLIKVLLLLCGVLAVTGVIQYVYYSVNMQAGANRFVFTLGFTVLLAVPLIYHLMMGDVTPAHSIQADPDGIYPSHLLLDTSGVPAQGLGGP
ncbi:MAG: hypothetical protein V8Q30_06330 [Acutalibacteraceae bacterium]